MLTSIDLGKRTSLHNMEYQGRSQDFPLGGANLEKGPCLGYPLKLKTPRIWPTKKMCGLLRLGGPWSVTWGPWSPWYVLRGPDSFCGVLIPPAAPWFVLPSSSTGAWFVLRDPYFVLPALIRLAGPCLSRGALVRRSGPWSVLRGPHSYCETLIRSVVLELSHRALIRLRALICLAGPWFVLRVHPAGPGFVL